MSHYPLTIVTAYYRFESKHSTEKYLEWMENMLSNIACPMVIFCDVDSAIQIAEFRKKHTEITKQIILPFEQLKTQKYNWPDHLALDPEKNIHNPNLYMIWNEKFHFLRSAITLDPFHSDWFMWSDIGCFRNKPGSSDLSISELRQWPNVEKLIQFPIEKITFIKTDRFEWKYRHIDPKNGLTKKDLKFRRHHISGSQFLGGKNALIKGYSIFYKLIESYFENGRFAGKDQNLYANLAISHKELFYMVKPPKKHQYFFLQRLLN
jgi:hypothetical protein